MHLFCSDIASIRNLYIKSAAITLYRPVLPLCVCNEPHVNKTKLPLWQRYRRTTDTGVLSIIVLLLSVPLRFILSSSYIIPTFIRIIRENKTMFWLNVCVYVVCFPSNYTNMATQNGTHIVMIICFIYMLFVLFCG